MDLLEACFFQSVNRHFNLSTYTGISGTGFTVQKCTRPVMDFSENNIGRNKTTLNLDGIADGDTFKRNDNLSTDHVTCFATTKQNLLLDKNNENTTLRELCIGISNYKHFNDFIIVKEDTGGQDKRIRLFEEQTDRAGNDAVEYEFVNDYLADDSNNKFHRDANESNSTPDMFKEALSNFNVEGNKAGYYFILSQRNNDYNFQFTPRTYRGF
jgi:hypothetical protein